MKVKLIINHPVWVILGPGSQHLEGIIISRQDFTGHFTELWDWCYSSCWCSRLRFFRGALKIKLKSKWLPGLRDSGYLTHTWGLWSSSPVCPAVEYRPGNSICRFLFWIQYFPVDLQGNPSESDGAFLSRLRFKGSWGNFGEALGI